MRNKVLVVDNDFRVKSAFEEALKDFIAEGGELFITDRLDAGVKIFQKEHPQLIFVSTQINDFDQAVLESLSSSIVLLSKEELIKNRFPTMTKPLKSSNILQKCGNVFKDHSPLDFPPL